MKRTSLWAVLTLGVTTALLAGCSPETTGQPQPVSTRVPTSAASVAPSRAPRVANPLDATRFMNDPCSALTSADLAGVGVTNTISGPAHDSGDPACTWTGSTGIGVSVGWLAADTDGLSDLYQKSGTIAYWQPITVSGYPAAYGDSISDSRSSGYCVINVGVNDHLFFGAEYGDTAHVDQSCALVRQVAMDVVKNLGGS